MEIDLELKALTSNIIIDVEMSETKLKMTLPHDKP